MKVEDNINQNINHHIRPFRDRKLGQIESFNLVMYKYIRLEYVLKMLETKVLRLDNIEKWEDVYENFVDKEDINLLNSSLKVMMPSVYYGQSWTTREESDAMWRIYSNRGSAVKVKTVYPLLFGALANWNKKHKDDIIWPTIDFVNYADEDEINKWLQSNSPMNYWAFLELQNESLFVKRREFEHEKEVRVIMKSHKEKKDYIEIDFDPYKMFREIVIDPRVSEDEFSRQRDNLIARGFDGNKIKKSTLYDFKRVRLEIDMGEPIDIEMEYYSKKEDKVKRETVYMNAPD